MTETAKKAEKKRLKKIEEMTPEEKAVYDKMSPARQEEYNGRLAMQDAQDKVHAARERQAQEREEKKKASEKEKAIKDIIKDVREGKIEATLEAVSPRFVTMGLAAEEYEKTLERIKTDSVSRQRQASIPAKPAYELTHTLASVTKDSLVPPAFSTSPDSTLATSLRRYGMIAPLLVRQAPDNPGKYLIMDGKRRYMLLPNDQPVSVIVVSGFPDEDTSERAEVTVNRVRSLNVLAVANALNRMRTRGVEDSEIRRDMGFKTGEIDKITSVITSLDAELGKALTAGNITPSVALSIAKLPKELQGELAKVYAERVAATPQTARITETDVEAIRQKRAAEAAKRDTPTLSGLAGAVNEADTTGGVDKKAAGKVNSAKSAPSAKK